MYQPPRKGYNPPPFGKDFRGVLGLPMRMVVVLIVGATALGTIILFLTGTCLFPKAVIVDVSTQLPLEEGQDVPVHITVKDDEGNPITDATVTITGLQTGDSNETDETGRAILYLDLQLPPYREEAYLEVEVSAPGCYERYHEENAIKVVGA